MPISDLLNFFNSYFGGLHIKTRCKSRYMYTSLFVILFSKFNIISVFFLQSRLQILLKEFPVDSGTHCSVYLLKANEDFNVFSGFIFSRWQQTWERAHRG